MVLLLPYIYKIINTLFYNAVDVVLILSSLDNYITGTSLPRTLHLLLQGVLLTLSSMCIQSSNWCLCGRSSAFSNVTTDRWAVYRPKIVETPATSGNNGAKTYRASATTDDNNVVHGVHIGIDAGGHSGGDCSFGGNKGKNAVR